LVENWGRRHFKTVLTVNLEREGDLHSLFSQPDPKRLLEELTLLKGQVVTPGETLLFLDEIQACPPAEVCERQPRGAGDGRAARAGVAHIQPGGARGVSYLAPSATGHY
jgi:hypothetical protein